MDKETSDVRQRAHYRINLLSQITRNLGTGSLGNIRKIIGSIRNRLGKDQDHIVHIINKLCFKFSTNTSLGRIFLGKLKKHFRGQTVLDLGNLFRTLLFYSYSCCCVCWLCGFGV